MEKTNQINPKDFETFQNYLNALGLVVRPKTNLKEWGSWTDEERERYLKMIKDAKAKWMRTKNKKKFNKKEIKLAKLMGDFPEIPMRQLMDAVGYSPQTRQANIVNKTKYWDELMDKYVNDEKLLDRLREFTKSEDNNLAFKSIVKMLEWKHRRALKDTQVKEAVERRIIFDK